MSKEENITILTLADVNKALYDIAYMPGYLDRWYQVLTLPQVIVPYVAGRGRTIGWAGACPHPGPGLWYAGAEDGEAEERIEDTHPPHRDTSLSLAAVTSRTLGRSHMSSRYIAQQTHRHRKPKLNSIRQDL